MFNKFIKKIVNTFTKENHQPFIDDFCYDDTYGMNKEVLEELTRQGMVFGTEFEQEGKLYGPLIIARDKKHAIARCVQRKLGEKVVGKLEETIYF